MNFTSSRSDRDGGAALGPPPPSRLAGAEASPGSQPILTSDDPSPTSPPSPPHGTLRLREGTQLLGRYEGSAYEQPTYLVRREDGQVIHLSHLLYLVAGLVDGERNLTEIAEELSTQLGRHVVADNIEYLVEKKLRPTGLIASTVPDDQAKVLTRSNPLLALRYRKRVIPARLHRGISTALQPLFWPPVIILMLGGLVAVNAWLFGAHLTALTRAARQLPFHPNLFLLVTALVICSGFFHELGHATATRYGGGSPGVMGVGIYLAWPAFYTDLTDSYRLNRGGRLRSDLGGVYFNAVLIVVAGVAYITTGFGPLAVFIVVSQAMAMYQFLPFIRLDGYYIMSDLVGVPNLFAYLGPVLRSMFRRPDPVTEAWLHLLKRRARVTIKIWSVVTVGFLAFNFGGLAVLAPIILPAEWASIHLQGQAMVVAFARDNVVVGINDLVDLLLVAIAPVGLLLIAGILLRRALQAIKKWWPTHPKVAAAFAALLAGALLFQGQGLVSRLAASPGSPGPPAMATKGAGPTLPGHEAPRSAVVTPALSPPVAPLVSAPSAPDMFYVVQPGDTLWGIAGRYLGGPERWPAIFDLNAGRAQPDGRTLVDPDLIYPGWVLELPVSQPAAALIPNPSPPVGQTDAVLAQPSMPPQRTAIDTGGAARTLSVPPTPAASGAVNPPNLSASGQTPTLADGTSREGGSAGQGIGGATVTSAQGQPTTTTTITTSSDQSTATQGCARRPMVCQSRQYGMGQPEASPPETTSWWTPPTTLPASSPQSSFTQGPGGGRVEPNAENGQAPIGVPSARSPPDAEGR
jgi:putative peptide zinc metalloprotease protein